MKNFIFSLCILFNFSAYSQIYTPPIKLVPNYNLNDIAMANYSPHLGSFVIIYNPNVVEAVGPYISAFFEAHEYAHIQRGHVTRSMLVQHPLQMIQLRREAEIDADKYAAEYFKDRNPKVIEEIINYFESSGNYGDLTHLPHNVRAKLIKKWVEEENESQSDEEENESQSDEEENESQSDEEENESQSDEEENESQRDEEIDIPSEPAEEFITITKATSSDLNEYGERKYTRKFTIRNSSDWSIRVQVAYEAGYYENCIQSTSNFVRTEIAEGEVIVQPKSREELTISTSYLPQDPPTYCNGIKNNFEYTAEYEN